MKTKHTPGPWKISERGEHPSNVRVITGDNFLARVCTVESYPASTVGLADAYLIAAAPDLLEALKGLQKAVHEAKLLDVKKYFGLCVYDAAAGKAIAKAEGRA